jgi:hypothetical protein
VFTPVKLIKGCSKKLVLILNASYTGKYYLPALSCHAMYNNTVAARITGQWFEVVKSGE